MKGRWVSTFCLASRTGIESFIIDEVEFGREPGYVDISGRKALSALYQGMSDTEPPPRPPFHVHANMQRCTLCVSYRGLTQFHQDGIGVAEAVKDVLSIIVYSAIDCSGLGCEVHTGVGFVMAEIGNDYYRWPLSQTL
jgi:hypothetical protein